MQSSGSACPPPEVILDWMEREMGYTRQQGPNGSQRVLPSAETIKNLCKGNMIPVFNFLLARVRSEKTVRDIRRNLFVYGKSSKETSLVAGGEVDPRTPEWDAASTVSALSEVSTPPRLQRVLTDTGRRRTRSFAAPEDKSRSFSVEDRTRRATAPGDRSRSLERSRRAPSSKSSGGGERTPTGETGPGAERACQLAIAERDAAAFDVARLRAELDRTAGLVRVAVDNVAREERDRGAVLASSSDDRFKRAALEVYDWHLAQEVELLRECLERLQVHLAHARQAAMPAGRPPSSDGRQPGVHVIVGQLGPNSTGSGEETGFYANPEEMSVRQVCDDLAEKLMERIRAGWPQYDDDVARPEGKRVEGDLLESLALKDLRGDVGRRVAEVVKKLLDRPGDLLRAVAAFTAGQVVQVEKETEKLDLRSDAERLRYNYENGIVTAGAAGGAGGDSRVPLQPSADLAAKNGTDRTVQSTFQMISERQRAHADQFMEINEAKCRAQEASAVLATLMKDLEKSGGKEEVEIWQQERKVAGLKAAVETLDAQLLRLEEMREERRAAEEALRQKWRKIEEFEGRRRALEALSSALSEANSSAIEDWDSLPARTRAHWANAVLPRCEALRLQAESARDAVSREVKAFVSATHLPGSSQGTIGDSDSSIRRIVAARMTPLPHGSRPVSVLGSVLDSSADVAGGSADVAPGPSPSENDPLGPVLRALSFAHPPHASPASLYLSIAAAVSEVEVTSRLGRFASSTVRELEAKTEEFSRSVTACGQEVARQEAFAEREWLVRLKEGLERAQSALADAGRIRRLLEDWYDQPARKLVPWVKVDGKDEEAWAKEMGDLAHQCVGQVL